MRSNANEHIDVGHWSSADEQKYEVSSADGSSARGQIAYKQSVEEFGADEWSYRDWRDARFQGTLPLALSARIPLEVFDFVVNEMDPHTLTAAALVCAAWYPQAMCNLYHTIEICSRASFNLLFKQCYASPRVKLWLASTYKLVVYEVGA